MATTRKRGNSYQIRVSCGYDTSGNQVIQTRTWTPDSRLTPKQVEKELERQKVLFEEHCKNGFISSVMKFQDFAEQWFKEYAEIKLKASTIRYYQWTSKRVYKEIGHLRMDKITTRTIQKFVSKLSNEKRLNAKPEEATTLSPKTIKLYVSFISTVFDYAIRMQMVSSNPCSNVVLPTMKQKERQVYTMEEVQLMLDLFEEEREKNQQYVMFFTLAIFTGLRRGELLGLEWKDFDWENNLMHVERNSLWTKEKGMYTDTPKTKGSVRVLKLPAELMATLKRYREWQTGYKQSLGDQWIENDRLFTKWDGSPMHNRSPYKFLEAFCKRHNMRFCNVHSIRHFHASVMILNGIDVKTVQSCLGHNDATTTLSIYAHTFQEAQARAMTSVADCIYKRSSGAEETSKKDSA